MRADALAFALAAPPTLASLLVEEEPADADVAAVVALVGGWLEHAYLDGLSDGLMGLRTSAKAVKHRRHAEQARPVLEELRRTGAQPVPTIEETT